MAKQYWMLPFIIALIPDSSIHTGDNIIISDVKVGDNSQIIGKGNDNKNTSEKAPDIVQELPKKSWLTRINNPVTFGGFVGFAIGGIGTSLYPNTPHIPIISVGIALFVIIVTSLKK